jgi:hypothetical protein
MNYQPGYISGQHAKAQDATPPNFLTYQNSTLGIKIQFPGSYPWNKSQASNTFPNRIYINYGYNAAGPIGGTGGPTIYIDVFRNMPLQTLIGLATPVITLPPVLDGHVKSTAGTFNGNPAQQLLFNWTQTYQNRLLSDPNAQPFKLTNMEILVSNHNNSYLIVYSAEQGDYNKYLLSAQQIINSFEITNPPSQNVPEGTLSQACVYYPGNCI